MLNGLKYVVAHHVVSTFMIRLVIVVLSGMLKIPVGGEHVLKGEIIVQYNGSRASNSEDCWL